MAPRYGTNEDLVNLFAAAHELDMHVLLDLVPGHTSTECKWFLESVKAEKNEYTDRYVWTDSVWEGYGSCLRGISDRDGSCMLNFFSNQPALNYGFYKVDRPWQQPTDAPGPRATVEELKNIMRFWLTAGCDGFRVDMAMSLVKNDDPDKFGTMALWQGVREFVSREFPNAALVSEWGDPGKAINGGFHMDFLLHAGPSHYMDLFRVEEPYFSRRAKGDLTEFIAYYKENFASTFGKGLICIPSGNHDMDRLRRHFDIDELRVVFAFLLSMPGAPFIYYGDEIAMRYLEGLVSVEGGYNRTGARSPMQWDSGVNAGFGNSSPEKLYIRLDESDDRPTAEAAMKDEGSLWNEIKRLIALRRSEPALGNYSSIEFINEGYPLVYDRTDGKDTVRVILNPSGQSVKVEADGKIIYTVGGKARCENGVCTADAGTAVFIKR